VDPKEALLRRQTHAAADGDKDMEQHIAEARTAKPAVRANFNSADIWPSFFSKDGVFSPVNTT
jgi:hypothetical protein